MLVTWVLASMLVTGTLGQPGCDGVWETFLKDRVPAENSFSQFKLMNSRQCYNLCARTQGCRAMSYNLLSKTCQLYAQPSSRLKASRDSLYSQLVDERLHQDCLVLKRERLDCTHCPQGHACVYNPRNEISSQCLPVVDCGKPPDVAMATKKMEGTKVESKVIYICNEGHVFNSTWSNISCTLQGTWTPLDGTCIANCSTPPQVDHASVPAGSTLEGSEVTYTFTCPLGWELQGHVTAVCNSSGAWEGPQGRCQLLDCGLPPSLALASRSKNTTTYGSSVSYTCQADWVYNGSDPTAVCSHLGNWTLPDGNCIANCSRPPDKDNATVSFSSTTEGAEARYHCVPGQEIRGQQTETCLPTGTWTQLTGPCQRCESSLTASVADSAFTASDYLTSWGGYPPSKARVSSASAWIADFSQNDANKFSWLQIDLMQIREVTALVTFGRPDADQYVKRYNLEWSNDTSTWQGGQTFQGNTDNTSPKTHSFDPPIIARYVRFSIRHIQQEEFFQLLAMRADLLGCLKP